MRKYVKLVGVDGVDTWEKQDISVETTVSSHDIFAHFDAESQAVSISSSEFSSFYNEWYLYYGDYTVEI